MRLRRILLANRGEIAVRLIRTFRRLGIETILAASEADLDSMAASMADITVCIGAPPSLASYLDVDAVINAAIGVEADAIHPGYGFLSENRLLAEACETRGIQFVGPTVDNLAAVGDKLKARAHAVEAGMPVVPGGEFIDDEQALALAEETGWPVLLKAVAGGGGKGLKIVPDRGSLIDTLHLAASEAQGAFGDPRIYLERYVGKCRHVEVQVLGDGQNVIHLGDRDCSVQRRYQKLVEEAPAPKIDDALRKQMHESAVAFARYLNYRSLGTVELLLDCERNTFYFLEMNARIQVEHPVTEAITGLDLVEEQLLIAAGRPMRLRQEDIDLSGHAIECRINAEDWENAFQPSPGQISDAVFPAGPGIRIDTHIQAGTVVPPYYDSLLAKLVVRGDDRRQAIDHMTRALALVSITGVATNTPMHQSLMQDADFEAGAMNTDFFAGFLQKQRDKDLLHG